MINPEVISEMTEQKVEITQEQMSRIHEEIKSIPKYDLSILSETLYDNLIENADHKLKNHILGRTIFHLKNIERLNTYVGVEKLFYATLIINPDSLFESLEEIDDETFEISHSIQKLLKK